MLLVYLPQWYVAGFWAWGHDGEKLDCYHVAGLCIAAHAGLTTPVSMKLRLFPILTLMQHDISTATQVCVCVWGGGGGGWTLICVCVTFVCIHPPVCSLPTSPFYTHSNSLLPLLPGEGTVHQASSSLPFTCLRQGHPAHPDRAGHSHPHPRP